VALHINPRFNEKLIVLNSMETGNWEQEIRESRMVFSPGSEFELVIRAEAEGFRIFVKGKDYILFKYRNSNPESVSSFFCSGRVKLFKFVYETSSAIVSIPDIFWRQMGGHLRKVETCTAGVTWGIGYDNCLWLYTGGWGGFLKGLEVCTQGINPMSDTHNYYIYENQRWNPISGFSTASLPTDRHLWSDVTGKHKRSKEYTKLLSMHWQWISDWVVDFHTPGGVDRDGWQYAVDFPASYHAKKQFTDYVRRRRWYRKARLNIKGPWQEVGNTRVVDISLQSFEDTLDAPVTAWAVSSQGDVLIRKNVSQSNMTGTAWDHVPCDQQLVSITCSCDNKVWAIGKSGVAYYRFGISKEKPYGESWQTLESPSGVVFKQISAGKAGVWALDSTGRLAVRKEINLSFPEGTHWQLLVNVASDPPHYEGCVGFKCVSVGKEVFATSNSGYVCKRVGITSKDPAGSGWNLGIPGNWQHMCVNSYS
jgi:tectonin beta-propeller repeat-containing protein 1